MNTHRRRFLQWCATAGVSGGGVALPARSARAQGATDRPGGSGEPAQTANVPASIRALRPMTDGIVPITDAERLGRLEKARRLMAENNISTICLEGGSSLFYFTGVRWGLSERPFVAVIPAKGELAWVCPTFEEARARELIRFGKDVRAWQEDDSPYRLIAQILKDRGVATGHEWTNFVRGNKTPLQPGMCFSDEPMIAIYGEFGIRLEDCLYISEAGAKFFSQPSPAIDRPFA